MMNKDYDSRIDTLLHKKRVADLMAMCAIELLRRGNQHDDSKLESPEKELLDEYTPRLKEATYGSDEYKQFLIDLKEALDNHYSINSHHPEYYENGINGFDLFDLMEMFFDWKASSERHDDGNIYESIDINKDRFGISEQVCEIMKNTAKKLNW